MGELEESKGCTDIEQEELLRTVALIDKDGKPLMSFSGGSGEKGYTPRVCFVRTPMPAEKMNQGEGL